MNYNECMTLSFLLFMIVATNVQIVIWLRNVQLNEKWERVKLHCVLLRRTQHLIHEHYNALHHCEYLSTYFAFNKCHLHHFYITFAKCFAPILI